MEPFDEKTIEIARRTRSNLRYIDEQHERGEKVYTFTHLFNSMLGMLVCVRENYYKGSNSRSVEWADLMKWNQLEPSPEIMDKADAFSTLISNLRHAFAHSNYDFISNSDRKISGIRVWKIENGIETWNATLTEEELREIANLAVEYLELMFGLQWRGEPEDKSYR